MSDRENLMLKHLKSIQNQLTDIRGAISDLAVDVRGLKGHQASFMQSEISQDGRIADLTARLERVVNRLDLRDAQ